MLENNCDIDDTENELQKYGEFSDAIKTVLEKPNYYHKLNEEDKQRILMKDILIQAGCFKKLIRYYVFTITWEIL